MAETTPPIGLQFNPEQVPENRNVTPGESQEIIVGDTAGKAVLLDDSNLESNNDGDHSLASLTPKSENCSCPNWIGGSSSRTKGLVGLAAMMLLSFVAVMIAGVAKLPSSSPDNGSSDGVSSASQSAAIDSSTGMSTATVPVPAPTSPESIRPNAETTATSFPTEESVIVPISMSKVNIQLPAFEAAKVPDFSDGLNVTEERNWELIEGILERTIYSSLSAELHRYLSAAEYSLESIQVDKFDGFLTSLIRKRTLTTKGRGNRHLQQSMTIHSVLYSSSVTVNCLGSSQCASASDTIASATSALSSLDFLVAPDSETGAPSSGVATGTPTLIPSTAVVVTPAPITTPLARPPTESPVTPIPTFTTLVPTSEAPTQTPPPPPLENRVDSCNIYTPCEMCQGLCYNDDQCEKGLLCFQRRSYEFIPGCEGPGIPGVSYCYDPFATGLTEVELLRLRPTHEYCDKKKRCEKCRGNCVEDNDCEKGLYCYRRYALELIPGCAGQGLYGMSYCFDPTDLPEPEPVRAI